MNNQTAENLMGSGTLWLPKAISPNAPGVDNLFYFIFWLSGIFFAVLIAVTIYLLIKYKKSDSNPLPTPSPTHNTKMELAWSIIPFILVMIIFAWGYVGWMETSIAPKGAKEIYVTGRKWFWEFNYPKEDLKVSHEMVIPVNTPIKLIMTSKDVIHSFFIPNARAKRDVLPNRYTTYWFEATEKGSFQIFCTEYCGDQHSTMLATLHVLSQEEYDEWVEKEKFGNDGLALDVLGKKLYSSQGCSGCHSIDGNNGVGPTWKGVYGETRVLVDGSSVVMDENYIRESILQPGAKVAKGFAPVMPSYAGSLKDKEISALIEYIKSLK